MTSQNSSTNSTRLSLETCLTNIFALTDLSGIRWRKFKSNPCANTDILEDPVLLSYTRCLNQAELLCSWARIPVSDGSAQPSSFMDFNKELWVFWYGDEPTNLLETHLAPDLQADGEIGSWEMSLLSYEIRTFLFKALHNVIERCLLSKGFVRIGKWFVQPQTEPGPANGQLSFSFENFFLHGESTVCVSVDVERKPPIYRITSHHHKLACGTAGNTGGNSNNPNAATNGDPVQPVHTPVILAPYGLAAKLTGGMVSPADQKMINDWQQFYPIPSSAAPDVPAIVEVIVGGVRMKYPSSFILTSETGTPPPKSHPTMEKISDICLSEVVSMASNDTLRNARDRSTEEAATWNYSETTCRANCTCLRSKNKQRKLPSSQLSPPKPEGMTQTKGFRGPFHRQPSPNDKIVTTSAQAVANSMSASIQNVGSVTRPGQAADVCSFPQPSPLSSALPTVPDKTLPSPSSIKPGTPLDAKPKTPAAPGSQKHPTGNTPSAQTPGPSPMPSSLPQVKQEARSPAVPSTAPPIVSAAPPAASVKPELSPPPRDWRKRPLLPQGFEDDVELNTEALYSFNSLRTWLDLPLKKFKSAFDRSTPSNGLHPGQASGYEKLLHPLSVDVMTGGMAGAMLANNVIINGRVKEEPDEPSSLAAALASTPVSLKTEASLMPKQSDLDNIFDTDDETGESGAPTSQTAFLRGVPISGSSMASAHISGPVSASELFQILPTPPSNTALSPDHAHTAGHYAPGCHEQENLSTSHLIPTSNQAHFLAVDEFEPIDLPSGKEAITLPTECVYISHQLYESSWQPPNKQNTPNQVSAPLHAMENLPATLMNHQPSSVVSAVSPAFYPAGNTPLGLSSPASVMSLPPKSVTGMSMENPVSTGPRSGSVYNAASYPEAQSLLVTMTLTDSMLNLYKDQNFQSCNQCVCNYNILGSDLGLYLPRAKFENQYKCSCGFSAVKNRSFGFCSGLFYEDECEIMNHRDDRFDKLKLNPLMETNSNQLNKVLLDELMTHFSSLTPSLFARYSISRRHRSTTVSTPQRRNSVQLRDICHVVIQALNTGQYMSQHNIDVKTLNPDQYWSRWPLQLLSNAAADAVQHMDVVLLLRSLQPALQEAVQHKRTTSMWEPSALKVTGPLSWQSFFQLAGRDAHELLKPQPVPRLLVSSEDDWLKSSPFTLQHWDKLGLKPYCGERNISYVVVVPQNDLLIKSSHRFFQDLSLVYESCQLGKHVPYQALIDGQFKVGPKLAVHVKDKPTSDWFSKLPASLMKAKLTLIARLCRHQLAPLLRQSPPDISPPPTTNITPSQEVFRQPVQPRPPTPSGMLSPPPAGSTETSSVAAITRDILSDTRYRDAKPKQINNENTSIVIYMINPFLTSSGSTEDEIISTLALVQAYRELCDELPARLKSRIHLQIVPLHHITSPLSTDQQALRSAAFHVFSRIPAPYKPTRLGHTMTGFGPVADSLSRKKGSTKESCVPPLATSPYVLAPTTDQINPDVGKPDSGDKVLFCAYCLSEDQRYLVASVIQDNGELLDTTMINIHVPTLSRRRKATVVRHALGQLWQFLIRTMAKTLYSWRVVIGRFGRIGHRELAEWSRMLPKKDKLIKFSRSLKEACSMCSHLPVDKQPTNILGVVVTSIEPHSSFNILNNELVNREDKRGSSNPLSTPHDASVTHVLVIPTSTNAGGSQSQNEANIGYNDEEHEGEPNILGNFQIGEDFGDLDMSEIFTGIGMDGLAGLGDLRSSPPPADHQNSINSVAGGITSRRGTVSSVVDNGEGEKTSSLLQQPLAMGYIISTAPTGKLPVWFYSTTRIPDSKSSTVLKSALHYHVGCDDVTSKTRNPSHPLDSPRTCDVLRFVLDSYNRLSWLTFDPVSNDRTSCLPIHMVTLMELYHNLHNYTMS